MNQDIWDSADNAQLTPSTYFGRVDFDMYYCVLLKGQGAVVFDPAQHKDQDRRTNITLTITPLSSAPRQFTTERRLLAESREWAGTVLPSIKALGLSTKEINNRWVQYQMVPSGRKYTNKDGEEKQATVPKFLAVYASEEEAEAAAAVLYNRTESDDPPFEPDTTESNNGSNAEREVALKFLPGLVAMAGKDKAKIATLLASNPLVSKYFTTDSDEVKALLEEVA